MKGIENDEPRRKDLQTEQRPFPIELQKPDQRERNKFASERVEHVLIERNITKELDKKRVLAEIIKRFETMRSKADLPQGTYEKAKKLIGAINKAFGTASKVENRPAKTSPARSRDAEA